MEVYQAAMKAWHEKLEDQKQFILICDNSSRFVQVSVLYNEIQISCSKLNNLSKLAKSYTYFTLFLGKARKSSL